jgi:hypothetical protein
MNTTLERARPFDRAAQPVRSVIDGNEIESISFRVSPIDRLSLRLGVWLLLRGARHVRPRRTHADQERALAVARQLEARERRTALLRAASPTN